MTGRIVVGVDGSDGSVAALRWALEEARFRRADVVVVHAWQYPHVADVAGMAAYPIAQDDFERGGKDVLDHSIAAAGPAPDGVTIEPILSHSGAASVLLETAKDADLLVVGSRGHGGFAGLLLGSVSQQVAHHAPCPVVIVPHL